MAGPKGATGAYRPIPIRGVPGSIKKLAAELEVTTEIQEPNKTKQPKEIKRQARN